MFGISMANVSVKIAELKDIAIDEIQGCIDEGNIKPEYAPYYILVYYSTQSKISESRSNLLTYCSNIVNVIEAATGITYDDNFKNVVIDFFIAFRSIENIDIDKRIEELEGIISKYKNLTVGTATLSGGGGSSGHLVSATAPDDTSVLWIDSANGYFAKIWDGSKWVGISAAWG